MQRVNRNSIGHQQDTYRNDIKNYTETNIRICTMFSQFWLTDVLLPRLRYHGSSTPLLKVFLPPQRSNHDRILRKRSSAVAYCLHKKGERYRLLYNLALDLQFCPEPLQTLFYLFKNVPLFAKSWVKAVWLPLFSKERKGGGAGFGITNDLLKRSV